MKQLNTIFLSTLMLATTISGAQLTLIPFENDFPDTIKQVIVGDPDNDGKDNIFVLTSSDKFVYKMALANDKINRSLYTAVNNRIAMFINQVNSFGDDVFFNVKGKKGLTFYYGKDSDHTELSSPLQFGENELENVNKIEGIKLQGNSALFYNLLGFLQGSNNVSYWQTASFSGNIVSGSQITSIKYPFTILGMASLLESDKAYNFFFLTSDKEVVRERFNATGPSLVLEPTTKLNLSLSDPTILLGNAGRLYIYDNGTKNMIEYNALTNVKKAAGVADIGEKIVDIKVGKFDENDEVDVLLQSEKGVWMLSDFGSKRSGLVKLITENEPIANFYMMDLNGDGFDEFCYYLSGSKKLKSFKIDITNSIKENDIFSVTMSPNPTDQIIRFNCTVDGLEIYDMSGKIVISNSDVSQIDISKLPIGQYIVQLKKNNVYTKKIINKI